ncbi:23S rRNA (uracil(747)-C(5))-methyltransferase RlmC [Nocardioides sp.]|uniref:23S rRNA (uracil(747)-C(5))-methyltransferase RlmC n=1 Tax=Nocardioides sp. TaxID=35761 RepID=UPI002BC686E6|nr:23S rRNA (uracil(747)-C(5))-methyltransferase RlmC [Nocardioides sp.]HXH79897.1 23S rRNA (uracil(747)-C(5))-methyltransferase RlmC [Nocardioides sp.]
MECRHFDDLRCRSCSLLEVPRTRQLSDKEAHARSLVPSPVWHPTVAGPDAGFRNKAKMVVGGTIEFPTLGILDAAHHGVDLRDCSLHSPRLTAALEVVARFITRAELAPYSVSERSGELKHVLVTESPDSELMLRFVVRSTADEARIRKHLRWLLSELPLLRVVSLNVQPTHAAVLEGEREIVLTDQSVLPMRIAGLELALRPQGFFQTNTHVAAALYAQARDWVAAIAPSSVWDLYCGVGGFALACTAPGRSITGVEVSVEAVAAATQTAPEGVMFIADDATTWALAQPTTPDLVIANPPRRGVGSPLAEWLETSSVRHVIYSSCNAESLARDLVKMPSLLPVEARVLDMFPHTTHFEVMVLLARRTTV